MVHLEDVIGAFPTSEFDSRRPMWEAAAYTYPSAKSPATTTNQLAMLFMRWHLDGFCYMVVCTLCKEVTDRKTKH